MLCWLLLAAAARVAASSHPPDFDLSLPDTTLFAQFVAHFGKVYPTPAERQHRFSVFSANVARARALNSLRASASAAVFGVTFFSDLLQAELPLAAPTPDQLPDTAKAAADTPLKAQASRPKLPPLPAGDALPGRYAFCGGDALRNTDRPRVDLCAPAANQGSCGGCYAASLANLGQYHLANRTYTASGGSGVLRARVGFQRWLDIARSVNKRCCGGNAMRALEGTMSWSLEEDYPFVDGAGPGASSCTPRGDQNAAVPVVLRARRDYFWFSVEYSSPARAVLQLKRILHHYGPAIVGIDSAATHLAAYRGGVIDATAVCGPQAAPAPHIDHGVLLVGWGEENGEEYWVLQNSWHPSWGERTATSHGYFRLRTSALCGIGYARPGYTAQNFVLPAYTCSAMPGCTRCDKQTKQCLECSPGFRLDDGECVAPWAGFPTGPKDGGVNPHAPEEPTHTSGALGVALGLAALVALLV